MQFLRAAVSLLMAVVFGWLATSEPAVAATTGSTVHIHTVGDPIHAVIPANDARERGPPTNTFDQTALDAVDNRSHGGSARPEVATEQPYTAYDVPVQLARAASRTPTTRVDVRGIDRDLWSFQRWRVAANAGERSIAIGEDMTNRVEPFAKKIGADTYKADPSAPREQWMENNRSWIRKQMDDGCTIYDCGPAPGRAEYPGPTSPYYKMELDELRDYPNYIRVWLGE